MSDPNHLGIYKDVTVVPESVLKELKGVVLWSSRSSLSGPSQCPLMCVGDSRAPFNMEQVKLRSLWFEDSEKL